MTSGPARRTAYEPLYDIDLRTGASAEILHADSLFAQSFGNVAQGSFGSALNNQFLVRA